MRSAVILGIACDKAGATELARRSRGTPRIANRFLKRVRDFAEVIGDGKITEDIAKIALDRLEVDSLGLDNMDKRMLNMIIKATSAALSDWKRLLRLSAKKPLRSKTYASRI